MENEIEELLDKDLSYEERLWLELRLRKTILLPDEIKRIILLYERYIGYGYERGHGKRVS